MRSSRRSVRALLVVLASASVLGLAGCSPEPDLPPIDTSWLTETATPTPTTEPTSTFPAPSLMAGRAPSGSVDWAIPDDLNSMFAGEVLATPPTDSGNYLRVAAIGLRHSAQLPTAFAETCVGSELETGEASMDCQLGEVEYTVSQTPWAVEGLPTMASDLRSGCSTDGMTFLKDFGVETNKMYDEQRVGFLCELPDGRYEMVGAFYAEPLNLAGNVATEVDVVITVHHFPADSAQDRADAIWAWASTNNLSISNGISH